MCSSITAFAGRYRFLSNFHPTPVRFRRNVFPSAEHAFQWAKTESETWQRLILQASTPSQAKYLGRKAPLRSDWEDTKIDVMRQVLAEKFADPFLREQLLATGDAKLVEGNTWGDRFWGQHPVGVGENWLGQILMGVRAKLRERQDLTTTNTQR